MPEEHNTCVFMFMIHYMENKTTFLIDFIADDLVWSCTASWMFNIWDQSSQWNHLCLLLTRSGKALYSHDCCSETNWFDGLLVNFITQIMIINTQHAIIVLTVTYLGKINMKKFWFGVPLLLTIYIHKGLSWQILNKFLWDTVCK